MQVLGPAVLSRRHITPSSCMVTLAGLAPPVRPPPSTPLNLHPVPLPPLRPAPPTPPHPHQYKFIVDGEWKYDPNQPAMFDEMRNVNNVIEVHEYVPENLEGVSGFEPPPSPPSRWVGRWGMQAVRRCAALRGGSGQEWGHHPCQGSTRGVAVPGQHAGRGVGQGVAGCWPGRGGEGCSFGLQLQLDQHASQGGSTWQDDAEPIEHVVGHCTLQRLLLLPHARMCRALFVCVVRARPSCTCTCPRPSRVRCREPQLPPSPPLPPPPQLQLPCACSRRLRQGAVCHAAAPAAHAAQRAASR